MTKKYKLALSVALVLVMGVFVGVGIVKATGSNQITTFNLIGDNKFKFHVVSFDCSTSTDETFTLPTTVQNNGVIQVVKTDSTSCSGRKITLLPSSGDMIEGGPEYVIFSGTGSAVTFVADGANRNWWAISSYR
ncbi:hypothetical protein KW796_01470 [Candidatus Parcubacteria bacterium]|nr:hypothetical protein [Candidatus Parcubacteria bacterium]